jgi:uncharacterized protein YndB with AHSA1/START domain
MREKMLLKDSIEIKTTPEKIFEWLIHMDDHYKEWHPDHVACYWVKGEPAEEGSVLSVEEYVHGDLHNMKFRISTVKTNRRIEYRVLFPQSLLCPRGSFSIDQKDGSCIFTATLSFRFDTLLSTFFRKRVEALTLHMKEEGENLKQLLE